MTINQAFIKAYRQDPAEPALARPATAAARPYAATVGTTVENVSATVGPQTFSNVGRTPLAPPTRESQGVGPTVWPTCDAPFGRVDPPEREAAIGKRPLSEFTSQTQQRTAVPARSVTESTSRFEQAPRFEPATTVASFAWPNVCRALCQQCGPELDRIADLLLGQSQEARSLIGVIGLFPQLGTTTTVLCVAARIAARRRRVIIVEGNFLAPRLAGWLDATPTAWWQDVLARGVPAADAVIHAVDDNLDLLPLDSNTANPLRLAGSLQAFNSASTLRAAYDLVIVDLGPFFDPASQPIALELIRNLRVDAALAVAGPQGADPRDVATIAEYLGQSGCNLLGTIENRTAKTQANDT